MNATIGKGGLRALESTISDQTDSRLVLLNRNAVSFPENTH